MRPDPDVLTRLLGEEMVLVHIGTSRIFELDECGATVWRLIDDGYEIDDIPRRLTQEFDVDEAKAAQDVKALVGRLLAERLLIA
jgi:hypothetical protein